MILGKGYSKVKIHWPELTEVPVHIRFRIYHGLQKWVNDLGQDPTKSFTWDNTAQYFPTHIILDDESALWFTLSQ
jgi:hypothetical protein